MKNLTGKDHEAAIDEGQIIIKEKGTVKQAKTKIVYITLDKPNHPRYQKMKNIVVISAREVWGNSTTHQKKEKEDNKEETGLGMEKVEEEAEKEEDEVGEAAEKIEVEKAKPKKEKKKKEKPKKK